MRFMEWIQLTRWILHGNIYLWLVMKKSSVSRTRKVYAFSDSVLCFWKMNENPQSNTVWEDKLTWFKSSPQYRILETIDGEPMELEWHIFTGCTTLQLVDEVLKLINKMGDPAQFQGRIIFMSMFNDISWRSEDNEQECESNTNFVSIYARRFAPGRWSFLGPGSEKKWYSTHIANPNENGTESLNWWWSNSEKADTQFSEPRVHCLEERSEAKELDNYQYTSVPIGIRLKLFFAQFFLLISSVSTEQSQMCVRNTVLVKQERWDPCWQSNLTRCSSQQTFW